MSEANIFSRAYRIHSDLSRRAMFGGLVYLGFLLALALSTDYPVLRPGTYAVVSAITVLCALMRLALGMWFPVIYQRRPRSWRTLLSAAVLVTAGTWGVFLGITFWWFTYYDWKTLILLVCMAGTAPVSLASFAPSMRLMVAYQVLFCGPMVIANLLAGATTGYTMAAVFSWYLVFILMYAQRFHFDYLELIDRQEIEMARRAAEEASRAKSDLLAQISHELRTPLNAVVGMTHLALNTSEREEQRKYLEIVQESSHYLVRLLGELLDVSRINTGMLSLDVAPIELRRLVGGVIAAFQPQAIGLGLTLKVEIAPETPEWVYADAGRLRQVLVNLVGNAIKFTEEGGITVKVAVLDQDSVFANVRFEVADTGIGIPAERQRTLFDLYARPGEPEATRGGGMGLGLAISSRLITGMGGEIRVESTPGSGSRFHWTLQMRKALPARSPVSEEPSVDRQARPMRILVAEDNAINQLLVRRLLERRHHTVSLARNGYEVLQALDDDSFDLILMDIRMPGLDGIQTTSAIRRREPARGGSIPIVALTANAQDSARMECLRAGMNGYLAKPVDPAELYQVVEEYAAPTHQESGS